MSHNQAFFGNTTYPNYVVHTNTKNLSFIKLYKTLKNKDIKNNKFFLRLYDRDLLNIDPFNRHLTPSQKNKVVTEIRKNPYYYLREIVRIPVPGGLQRFELHRGNLAITWSIFNSIDFFVMLPRQQYKTVSIVSALSWVYHFNTNNTHLLFGNKSLTDAKNNLKRFKDIVENLPEYIKEAIIDPRLDEDNIEKISSSLRNNKIDVSGPSISEAEADKAGKIWPAINLFNCWKLLIRTISSEAS
jgi:hypothetical protein